ncbi:MAG: glycerol-3-phosphate 1-O-acyltransferase PlsY [Candidatus Omnitrophota bacterium]
MIFGIFALILSYLLGSVPTAFLAGKILHGIDIRRHGSGNVGTTNAFRVLGKGPGAVVFLIDVLKGMLPLTLIAALFGVEQPFVRVLLGASAVAGHNWTVFLNFKGGKGIATSLGVILGMAVVFPLMWVPLMLCVVIWAACFYLFGYVSLASMAAAVMLPVTMAVVAQPPELVLMGAVFAVFAVVRHRSNISRLIAGVEPRVFWMGRRVGKE